MTRRSALESVAENLSIKLSNNEIEEHIQNIASLEHLIPDAPTLPYGSESATEVNKGADNFGAFRYEFRTTVDAGSLSGNRMAVKDNIAVTGVPLTCGSSTFSFTPSADATVVKRLRAAGAEIIGTTNMDEFALSTTGETCNYRRIRNPVSKDHIPGGSSGGSASAVAAGLVDGALGTDTGGSIRIPASFCGVVGLKPTHGTVSRFGYVDLSPTADVIGPLAKSTSTVERIFDAIQGPDILDPSTHLNRHPDGNRASHSVSLEDISVGIVEEAINRATDEVRETVMEATDTFQEHGLTVTEVSIDEYEKKVSILEGITGPEFGHMVLRNGQTYGIGTGFDEKLRAHMESFRNSGTYDDILREQLLTNLGLVEWNGGTSYVAAQLARMDFIERMAELFDQVDAIVTPTTPMTAPPTGELCSRDEYRDLASLTAPFNLTGGPAISVPVGTVGNLPVGLQIGSDWFCEPLIISIGSLLENR